MQIIHQTVLDLHLHDSEEVKFCPLLTFDFEFSQPRRLSICEDLSNLPWPKFFEDPGKTLRTDSVDQTSSGNLVIGVTAVTDAKQFIYYYDPVQDLYIWTKGIS